MPARIPATVQPLLDEYLAAVARELPGFVTAFYIHGSIALGEFQPQCSDIDFIAVISRRASEDDLARLTAIHNTLKAKYPTNPLSGSYLQPGDLGRFSGEIEPAPYFQDGVMQRGHFDINAVTWWILKQRGQTLLGTSADQLSITVDMDRLAADTLKNMNTYWVQFIRQPARMATLLSDWGVQWAIPGVLRQFYTLRERGITSKTGACKYALEHVPARWHRIIQEAINIRSGRAARLYRLRPLRAVEGILFLRYIIGRCNRET
jgi:predicted nucleotidyltransferase